MHLSNSYFIRAWKKSMSGRVLLPVKRCLPAPDGSIMAIPFVPENLGPTLVRMSWAGSGSQITGPLEAFQTEPRSTYSMLKKYQLNVLRKSPLFFLHTRTNLVAPLCINFALDMSYKNLNCP